MKGLKRALSLLTAAAMSASIIPAVFAANTEIDFEEASSGWSFTYTDAYNGETEKAIDGYNNVIARFSKKPTGSETTRVKTGVYVEEESGNHYVKLTTGGKADTETFPEVFITDMPESSYDDAVNTIVGLSFRARMEAGTFGSPKLCIGDSITLSPDMYGIVLNQWQKYELTLSAKDKNVTMKVDGKAAVELSTNEVSFGAISSQNGNYSGTIYIDDISISKTTFDNSPTGQINSYLDSIMPSANVDGDIKFAEGNDNYRVTWTISDENIISKSGKVTPQIDDTIVSITAEAKQYKEPYDTASRTVEVKVKGIGDLTNEQGIISDDMAKIAADIGEKQPDGAPAADIWISKNIELPVQKSANGWINTEWSSDNGKIRIVDGYAKINPPVESDTVVSLTARVYSPVNPAIVCEKTYKVGVLKGSGSYSSESLGVYADIDFSGDINTSVNISTSQVVKAVGGGQAELVSGERSSGANTTTYATVSSGGELNLRNGEFANSNRNCFIRFTNSPDFSSLGSNAQMKLSFKAKLSRGSADTDPEIHINRQLELGAASLGVKYDEYFMLTLIADYSRLRLFVMAEDLSGNIISINDYVLSLSNFSTIENISALNNGTLTIDDIKLEAFSNELAQVSIDAGMSGASVLIAGMAAPFVTGSDNRVSFYLPVGEYQIMVSAPKYYTETITVGVSGDDRVYTVTLTKKDVNMLIDEFTNGNGTLENQGLTLVKANGDIIVKPGSDGKIPEDAVYEFDDNIKAVSTDKGDDNSELFSISYVLSDAELVADGETDETLPEDLNSLVSADGNVTPLYNANVSGRLSAVVSAADTDKTAVKTFDVVIQSIKSKMDNARADLVAAGILCNGSDASAVPIVADLTLPKLDSKYSNMSVSWESKSQYLSNEGKLLSLPPEETDAMMTAKITYGKNGVMYAQEQDFAIKLASSAIFDTILENAIGALTYESVDTRKAVVDLSKFVSEDFYLPKKSQDNAAISFAWTSDSDVIVIAANDAENDIARFYPKKDSSRDSKHGITATLKLKASYLSGAATLATLERDISFGTLFDETKDGKYKVRGDAACDENFEVTYNRSTRKVTDLSNISSDVTGLKTEGYFGSLISWNSSSTALKVSSSSLRPSAGSNNVNLTLSIAVSDTNSSEPVSTISVPLTIPGTGGGGGSSSSGNSSGNSGSTIKGSVTGAPVVAPSSAFTDLTSVEWAKTAIESLASKGVVTGKQNGIFAPNDNVTRAEFAQMLIKAMNLSDANAETDALTDVNPGDWYYNSVASAYSKGIISGYENGSFGVSDLITRQDMAVIVYRAANAAGIKLNESRTVSFADETDIAGYAHDAVIALANAGLINGMSDSEFSPMGTATRAQAALIIYNISK